MSESEITITKYAGSVLIGRSVLEDALPVRDFVTAAYEGLWRDLRGERKHGPFRRWEWEVVDDSYLDALSHDELVAEAKRLHEWAVALVEGSEHLDPADPTDVADAARIVRPVWHVE